MVMLTMDYMQCSWCKHELPPREGKREHRCLAFPEGIPCELSDNQHIHTEPYPGDNGILFELREGADPGTHMPFRTYSEIASSIYKAIEEAGRDYDPEQARQTWRKAMEEFAEALEEAGVDVTDYRIYIDSRHNDKEDFEAYKRWDKEWARAKAAPGVYRKFLKISGVLENSIEEQFWTIRAIGVLWSDENAPLPVR